MTARAQWSGFPTDVTRVFHEAEEPDGVVATMTVRLTFGDSGTTPSRHYGRLVAVPLTRPMLEVLARLACDARVVDYVQTWPRDELGNPE